MRRVLPKKKLEPYEEFLCMCLDPNHEARCNHDIITEHAHEFDIEINDYDLLLNVARNSDYLTFNFFLFGLDADFLINGNAIIDLLLLDGRHDRVNKILQHTGILMDEYFQNVKQNSFMMKCISKRTKTYYEKYF